MSAEPLNCVPSVLAIASGLLEIFTLRADGSSDHISAAGGNGGGVIRVWDHEGKGPMEFGSAMIGALTKNTTTVFVTTPGAIENTPIMDWIFEVSVADGLTVGVITTTADMIGDWEICFPRDNLLRPTRRCTVNASKKVFAQ